MRDIDQLSGSELQAELTRVRHIVAWLDKNRAEAKINEDRIMARLMELYAPSLNTPG